VVEKTVVGHDVRLVEGAAHGRLLGFAHYYFYIITRKMITIIGLDEKEFKKTNSLGLLFWRQKINRIFMSSNSLSINL